MKCNKCGVELKEGDRFCGNCGTQVIRTSLEYETKIIYEGEIKKCPNCGRTLKSFVPFCPECGLELREIKSVSSVSRLVDKLEALEAKKSEDNSLKGILKKKIRGKDIANIDRQKIELIKNFPIPNAKEDILEFMILASTNMEPVDSNNMTDQEKELQDLMLSAWKTKYEQAYKKAKVSFGHSEDFKRIDEMYKEQKREAQKKRFWIAFGIIFGLLGLLAIPTAIVIGVNNYNKKQEALGKVQIGYSSDEFEDMNYEYAVEILETKGFSNIETIDLNDLVTGWLEADGEIEKITINGDEEFSSDSYFDKDSKIVITYHTFPEEK